LRTPEVSALKKYPNHIKLRKKIAFEKEKILIIKYDQKSRQDLLNFYCYDFMITVHFKMQATRLEVRKNFFSVNFVKSL
jgi:hypothetical protein